MIIVPQISQFLQRILIRPLLSLLTQGLSPQKLSMSVACGATFSTFPVIGSTTILCTLASYTLNLNLPAIQLVNYFAFPLQLLLLPVFIRMGELLFSVPPMSLSALQIVTMVQTDTLGAISTLWWATMRAIIAWFIFGPPTILLLYRIFVPIFIRLAPAKVSAQE